MENLENKLNEMLVKKAPFQLPENARKWIAEYAWVFALVGLVLGIMGALSLLTILGFVSTFATVVGATKYMFFAWISLLALVAYLIVIGMAVPKLKNKEARGWDLIFYSELAYFGYCALYALSYIGAGAIYTLFWNLVGLVISLYFIFQVRSQFKGATKKK